MNNIKPLPFWTTYLLCIGSLVAASGFIFVAWDRYGVLAALPLIVAVFGFASWAYRYYAVGNRKWAERSVIIGLLFVMAMSSWVYPWMLHSR